MRKDGFVVVSLPNVANLTVRLSLLFGRFNYSRARHHGPHPSALLHTPHGAAGCWKSADTRFWRLAPPSFPRDVAWAWRTANLLVRALRVSCWALATALLPTLFGYQFVFLARRK